MDAVSRLTGWLEGATTRLRQRSGAATPARDWDLWRAACTGHAGCARQLVTDLTPGAYALALQLLRRPEDAEDAVQDAFLRLWRSHPTDTEGARLSTYFNTIVINRCRSLLVARREEATEPEALTDLHDAQQIEDASDSAGASGAHDAVGPATELQRGLQRLPVRQRMAVVMWAYADAGVPEIARALDIDPNAAHQLLHRAKAALRNHLDGGLR